MFVGTENVFEDQVFLSKIIIIKNLLNPNLVNNLRNKTLSDIKSMKLNEKIRF